MLTTPESGFTLTLQPSPTGPMTLHQEKQIGETAIYAMERASYGRGFIPAGSIERTRREQGDLHARIELLLEAHPQLEGMYTQHETLLNEYYGKKKKGEDVAETQRQCVELGEQIVALERSVDLGKRE